MKKKKRNIASVFLVLLLAGANTIYAANADSYICTAERSIGFKYNKNSNKWEEAKFDVDEKRYIVTREKSQKVGRKVAWTVKEYNQQETALICEDDFNPFGNLFCGGGIFRMNRFNLRYIYTLIGYYNSNIIDDKGRVISHEGGRGTFIELGSCR
jgi:hypothetical protein